MYQKLLKFVRYLVRKNIRLPYFWDFVTLWIATVFGQFINFLFSLSVQFLNESFFFKNYETFFRNKYTNTEEISADNEKGSSTTPDKKLA